MSTTSGAGVCEDGLVDDSFLLYTTIPCSLRLNVHVGLSVLWVILSALLLIEVLVSRLLGHFSKFHAEKKGNANVYVRDAAYVPFVLGGLIIFMIVICDPQASVQDSIGSGIWFAAFLSLSGVLALPAALTVSNTQPLLAVVGVKISSFKQADFNTRIFQIIKYVQYVVCASFFIVAFVTLIILPNTLVNFRDRWMSINVCFLAFGVAFALVMSSVTATSEAIVKVVNSGIQFERDLPAHRQDVSASLSVAKTRLRFLTIVAPTFGLLFCLGYVLIGATVIPLNWIVAHVIFGFLPASSSLTYRLLMRDSILEAHCCLERQTSAQHSSKDRDMSDHGSAGKVAAMEQAQISTDYTHELSTTSSELLAKLDLSSLKTPAHALLTMHDNDPV